MNACCGTGPYGGVYSCGGTKSVSDQYELCENADEDYVWFDSLHATERIHEQFAKAIWSEPASPGANTLQSLFFGSDTVKISSIEDEHDEL